MSDRAVDSFLSLSATRLAPRTVDAYGRDLADLTAFLKGSPADPNRIYASQTSGWFGQIIQRYSDGGKTWEIPGGEPMPAPGPPPPAANKFVYDTTAETGKPLTTHQWYDGTQHPRGVQARLAP